MPRPRQGASASGRSVRPLAGAAWASLVRRSFFVSMNHRGNSGSCFAPLERFEEYRGAVDKLRSNLPQLYRAVNPGGDVSRLDGWDVLRKRYEAYLQRGGSPVLVATLYGPTGAGKSTIFRLLTGVDVPAGDDVRPVSFASVVAAPPEWDDPKRLRTVFPSFCLERLTDVSQLRERGGDAARLFHVPFADKSDGGISLILADVPDFNSIEQTNWSRAESVLQRAEIVLFAVFRESYCDERVIAELARCCRLAARMAFLLTKTDSREQAERIWNDLIQSKLTPGSNHLAANFQQCRADGVTTLHQFLSQCHVYFSPRRAPAEVKLEEINPLHPEQPAFVSLLRGADAENVLLASLLEPVAQVVNGCRELLTDFGAVRDNLEDRLCRVDESIANAAERIAGNEFPFDRMMQLIHEEIPKSQSKATRWATVPIRVASRGIRAASSVVRQVVSKRVTSIFARLLAKEKNDGTVQECRELESERIAKATGWLLNRWRSDFPYEAQGGLLAHKNYSRIREEFQRQQLPEPGNEWEPYVRQAVGQWAREHPWLCNALPVTADVALIGSVGLLVVDIATTGGLFGTPVLVGTLGLSGAAAGGSTAAAVILKWAEKRKLENVFRKADEHWRRERATQLRQHLRDHLQRPLFQSWIDQRAKLQEALANDCRQACEKLEVLVRSVPDTA